MGIPTTFFYTLVAFALMWKTSQAIDWPHYGKVEIVNGKCKYGNRLVANGATLNFEEPCESWTCHVPSRSFDLDQCDLIDVPLDCTVFKGTGPYPNCCYHVNCTGTPQLQDTWYENKYQDPEN